MDLAAAIARAAALWHAMPHGHPAWDLLETVAPFAFTEPMNTGGTLTGASPCWSGSEVQLVDAGDVPPAAWPMWTDPGTGGRPCSTPDLSSR